MSLLSINDLTIKFHIKDQWLTAVNGFNCQVERGQILGIVGESGSGKTQIVLSIMRLLAKNAHVSGSVDFENKNLLSLALPQMRKIRGNDIAMIFQDPMSCLNPYMRIGQQLMEVLLIHQHITRTEAKNKVLACLDAVKISDVNKRFDQYPHELSGGMRQRIMIAMALLCQPKLLIADEPTTALDVTVQADILALLNELKKEYNMAIILITHDMGVVAGSCDDVIVLYGGKVMEYGRVDDIFYRHRHPYTKGLLAAIPKMENEELYVIPGNPPSLLKLPLGCPFSERCQVKIEKCSQQMPALSLVSETHKKACYVNKI